jgi:hypothetical protein
VRTRAFLEHGRWLVETGIDSQDVQVTIEFAGKLGRMHAHYRMVDDLRPLLFAYNAEEVKKLLRGDISGTLRGIAFELTDRGTFNFEDTLLRRRMPFANARRTKNLDVSLTPT